MSALSSRCNMYVDSTCVRVYAIVTRAAFFSAPICRYSFSDENNSGESDCVGWSFM